MNLRNLLTVFTCLMFVCCFNNAATAQCKLNPVTQLTPPPGTACQAEQSGNIVPFFNKCGDICANNSTTGQSGEATTPNSCIPFTPAHDLFLYADNPYSQLPNYDGSLVFRWVSWPNMSAGVPPPYLSVEGNVAASLAGISVKTTSCSQSPTFALQNAICEHNNIGNQFYAPAGTIPTLAQLTPIVENIAGVSGITLSDVAFWIYVATSDNSTGNICFEVSPYQSGFLCGDPNTINLTGNTETVSGSAPSICLCDNALYGGIAEPANDSLGLAVPCGTESAASVWYKVIAPFDCNRITASMGNWGGNDSYNIVILKGVDCPGVSSTNPITGALTFIPGQKLQSGVTEVGSGCGGPASNSCNPVASGEYYIVVSGKTERPTFQLNVTIDKVSPTIGTAQSPQNNKNLCSGSPVTVSSVGNELPLNASCGQTVLWYYSTNISFNPYNGQGTFAGSDTSNVTLNLPANTSCQPVTYYIKGIISDNGTTAVAACKSTSNTITVNVYPEIGQPTIDNSQCIITVAAKCPSFTVNGKPTVDNFVATFADNGSVRQFIISNGIAQCDTSISQTVSCSGNCTQPKVVATAVCDSLDPYNFYVNLNFTPGSAASYYAVDNYGGTFPLNGAGTYQVGPYPDGISASISVDNPTDSACNLPLGSFIQSCNTIKCPNLTSASANVTGNVCQGQQTVLTATVDQGKLGTDYTIQWYNNGVPIANGNTLNHFYTFATSQGCSPETQLITVAIRCLKSGATPSTDSSMTAGQLVVYPLPQFGRDVSQDPTACEVKPIDNCGGLNLTYNPSSNPSPGASPETVDFTASVSGAPNGCVTSGSYIVDCNGGSTCTNVAGEGTPLTNSTVCYGDQYTITSTGSSINTGYTQYWAVTTVNPYADLNTAVANAINSGNTFVDNTGNGSFTFTSGTTYGPGDYYFIPFISLSSVSAGQTAYSTGTQSLNVPALSYVVIDVFGDYIVITYSPVYGNATIPQLPYCSGLSEYNINFTANRTSGSGNPIDGISGLFTEGSGGSYNQSSGFNQTLNNYTANPSGQSVSMRCSSLAGATEQYSLTVNYAKSITAPVVCPSCQTVGTPVHVTLVPKIVLSPISPSPVCAGASIDLTTLNPAVTNNYDGIYTWYLGDPDAGGQLIADPTNVVPANGFLYFVTFQPYLDTVCTFKTSTSFTFQAPPTLTPIPAQAPSCFGVPDDLTVLEPAIASDPGTFVWYKGNPDSNGVRLPDAFARSLVLIPNQLYYVVFTDDITGCSNTESTSFSVLPQPSLNALPDQHVCGGGLFDLTTLQAGITTAPGTFAWYIGNPAGANSTLLNLQQVANVQATGDTTFYVQFTDSVTTCTAITNVKLDLSAKPALIPPVLTKICSDTVIDLTAFQNGIISTPGYFTWYAGQDSANGGVALTSLQAQTYLLDSTTTFYVNYVNPLTGCNGDTNFTYPTILAPILAVLPQQVVCIGQRADLNSLDTDLTYNNGFFNWFIGDPKSGGTSLTTSQASSQLPNDTTIYYVQFLAFPSGCAAYESFSYVVNPGPSINTIPYPGNLCANQSIDLTAFDTSITTEKGTFAWYSGDPSLGGTIITGSQLTSLVPAANTNYYVVFSDSNGCTGKESISFPTNSPITGVNASYDCNANDLVVNLSNASGGAGGYIVAATSPDTNGEVLQNTAPWEVIVADSVGCTDTLKGTVNCHLLVCTAGVAASVDTAACCGDSVHVTVAGDTVSPGNIIAWALTPFSSGPVNSIPSLQAAHAAGNVYKGDSATGGLTLVTNCTNYTPGIDYYLTPFIAEAAVVDSVIWDTTAGCRPIINVCPTISGTGWQVDSLVVLFPNGVSYNVNKEKFGGIALTPALLTALGGKIPCFNLSSLYSGNPNGTWAVKVYNSGAGAVSFAIPAFQIIVSGDSGCTILGAGNTQVTNIDEVSGTIAGGTNQTINILIPPLPADFPTVDTACESFGTPVVIYIKPVDSCSTGINPVEQLSSVNIYPNPTENSFTVDGYLQSAGDVKISVIDMVGAEVNRIEKRMEVGRFKEQFDLSTSAQGVYFVTIKTESQTITRRIAKQ